MLTTSPPIGGEDVSIAALDLTPLGQLTAAMAGANAVRSRPHSRVGARRAVAQANVVR